MSAGSAAPSYLVSIKAIEPKILFLRGEKVLLSKHLAELYEVEPKVLMQSVKRNIERFPDDFMFQLTSGEFHNLETSLKSHFVTSNRGGIRRAMPYAFTEQGVAMLSSVLNSPRAIQVNIAIMRAFVQLRKLINSQAEISERLAAVEHHQEDQDVRIATVFEAIQELVEHPEPGVRRVYGFPANHLARSIT